MRASPDVHDLADLEPFDTCVTLANAFPWNHTARDIVAMMDRYRIREALVHENHARTIYPREHGNLRLMQAIKGESRLHPVWVVEPPKVTGRDAARRMVGEMLSAGVRAARWPMSRIPPMPWLWDDLSAALEEHRVPCFLDFGDETTCGNPTDSAIDGVREIAVAHPELPLVFSHVMGGLGVHPAILPLMRRTPNIYVDGAGLLEYWREAALDPGPERVLFASGFPATDPGILIANYQYARDLDLDAKKMMYGGNIRRLLGNVR